MKKCQLEDTGVGIIFEALAELKRLKEVDLSSNNIFDAGIKAICPFIGTNIKSKINILRFNHNEVSDLGFRKLLRAIEENENHIQEISFSENQLTDSAAIYLVSFLKNIRMQDVEHSMNIVAVDLSLNKILFKTLKDVETQLHINQKFAREKKRIRKD